MTISASSSSDSVEDSKVNVAVRVRPFNKRELDLSTKCVVQMEACQTFLYHPSDDKQPKPFTFDYCFESTDDKSRKFADNEDVFNSVGASVVDNAFDGYNACIFAYGQTGSGKSYTMMGSSKNPGIIPRLCNSIFERIGVETNEAASFKVEVSYMEIYNERVRDLLDLKKSAKCNLKVREHKSLGPMVDGLSVLAVSSFDQIARLIDEGNKCRTVAATNMNAESSRSHAVFTIRLTQTLSNIEKGFSGEKVAKISLVDLAGSERAGKTGAIGKRLEEGGNINKSLTTLGRVISALAERSGKKEHFVPYRDSVLTWLLKDNLGGNSKTVMIATVSPAADNYEETLSTLRYAERAKKIVNHAIINEDPNAKIIRELREEVEMLRSQIVSTRERETECNELKERLAESERLVERMNKSWEERLKETDIVYEERQRDLANIGICVAESGIKVQKDRFYLVNLNSDPSLNECLVYYINQRAVIGCATNGTEKVDFVLQGIGVQPHHAVLEVVEDEFTHTRRLFITPLADNARVCVNGQNVAEKTLLKNGSRVLIGFNHFFRVNCPKDNDAGHLMTTSIMMESQFDYDKAFYEANSDEQTFSSLDVVIEQINIKHQEDKQAALEEQYELFEKFLHSVNPTLPTPMTPMTPAFGFPMTPMAGTPSCALPPVSLPSASATRHCDKSKFVKWAQHREEVFKESLKKLKTEIVRANALAREANMITDEVSSSKRGQTRYDVTLQIPAGNLRPSRINAGALVCEPFIMVRRQGMHGHHLWSVEQLENKLIDMRDAYNDRMNGRLTTSLASSASAGGTESDSPSSGICDDEVDSEDVDFGFSGDQDDDGHNNGGPTTTTAAGSMLVDNTFESQEKHSLIGVANVFLEVLFHEMKLDYKVPIISQQGEVRGKLHVEVFRVPGAVRYGSSSASSSTDSLDPGHPFLGRLIRCRIRIKTATSLPQHLSHFVFCQYSFFNISDMLVVAPVFDPEAPSSSPAIRFDHEHDFDILVTDEFLEYVQEDALSIEVWGHRSAGLLEAETNEGAALAQATALKHKGLQERWSEVTSRLELWIDFLELNEDGHFAPVRVDPDPATAGVYHLKHGQQKRIRAGVRVLSDRGGLPVAIADITDVAIGSIVSTTSEQLDSYQEEDLNRIRSQWTEALANRQQYLQAQMDSLSSKTASRTSSEVEREQSLINQWVALTEERNAVSLPTPNSCIPGAPADWTPPPGIERHVPVVFLDLSADDLGGIGSDDEEGALEDVSHGASLLAHPRVCGENSTLPCERCDEMIGLPILGEDPDDEGTYQGPSGGPPSVVCSWDSTMHPGGLLNRATAPGERIYGVVTVRVRLSHPAPLDLVLRKRVALHVYKKPPSFTERLMQRIVGSGDLSGSGVCYDVVAHIPRSTHDVEDRESLAMMAARPDEASPNGPPAVEYVEAYTKCIQAVEWMLKLDRLRQESALRHMLGRQERARHSAYHHAPPGSAAAVAASQRMKRTVSLPNTINNVNLPPIPGRMQQQLQRGGPCGGQQLDDRTMETSTTSSSGYSSMVNSLVSPLMDPATVNANGRLSGIDEEQQPAGASLLQHRYLPPSEPGSTAAIGEHVVRSFTVPETLHSSVNENFSPKRVSPRLLSELSQSRGSSFTSPLASTTTHTGAVPSGNFITPDRPSTPPDYSLQQADNSHSINNNNLFSCTNKLFDDEEAFIHAPPPATTTRGAPINGNGNGTLAVDFEFDVSHA